jgi:hypothetical protein
MVSYDSYEGIYWMPVCPYNVKRQGFECIPCDDPGSEYSPDFDTDICMSCDT